MICLHALSRQDKVDETLKILLDMIRKDKKWRDEVAKTNYVKVCNVLQVSVPI